MFSFVLFAVGGKNGTSSIVVVSIIIGFIAVLMNFCVDKASFVRLLQRVAMTVILNCQQVV